MKNYLKPEINIKSLLAKETLSSLSDWLEGNNFDYADCNITTYEMQS